MSANTSRSAEPLLPPGCAHRPGRLAQTEQTALLAAVETCLTQAPLMRPMAPWGKPLSVSMSNAGRLGWVTDRSGYRYQPTHPETGRPWPPIPTQLLTLWRSEAGVGGDPDCCLINHYPPGSRLGLHRDDTEAEWDHPVLSVSLGDAATFRIGGLKRSDPSRSLTLESGDMFLLAGPGRLAYHGIDRIKRRAPNLLDGANLCGGVGAGPQGGGRLSLTLRIAGPIRDRAQS